MGLLAAATLIPGLTRDVMLLPVALVGLRFAGQGLCSHISQTIMGRYFERNRGKAFSLSALGYSAGEILFPLIIAAVVPLYGWRTSIILNILLLIIGMIPVLVYVFRNDFSAKNVLSVSPAGADGDLPSSRWKIMKMRQFRILAPSVMLFGLTTTGVFFYQMVLADSRGWDTEWYLMVFSVYAVSRFVFGLPGGPRVDRYSAGKLFPVMHVPLIAGGLLLIAGLNSTGLYFNKGIFKVTPRFKAASVPD